MSNNNLIEKLTLQSESFQEGFEILCRAFSFNELVKNFLHLIRGNFLISEVSAFHKANIHSEWKTIHSNNKNNEEVFSYFNSLSSMNVEYPQQGKYSVKMFLPLSDKSFLAILIGNKLDKTIFSDYDKITLQILIQVFDSAHRYFLNQKREKALIFELNEKVAQLNNLIDTVIDISRYDKRNTMFETALERIASLTCASAVLLQIKIKDEVIIQYSFPKNVLYDEMIKSSSVVKTEFDYNGQTYFFLLAEKESREGSENFNELDKLLLEAIIKQIKTTIENEYLNNQAKEKEKMEQELIVAASIQQKILPVTLPAISGYQIAGTNIPSKEVGGDYFNCFKLGNEKFALTIADVAGKGISAALLVSTLDAALYSYLQFEITLPELAERLNKLIYKSSPSDKYITFFIAVLDSVSGELDILNAGHNPIFLMRKNGELEKFDAGGVGLGMFDLGFPFVGQKSKMNSGDKLFFYTDGIPEAMNVNEEEYTDEKMLNFFKVNSDCSPEEFIDLMVKDVKQHTSSVPQSDDITLMLLKRI
uniref:Serine/threonine-protein phosphatase n=1 Tax=Ignavibacterium album TaxID=591197 RepID=A0A832G015_9BACT